MLELPGKIKRSIQFLKDKVADQGAIVLFGSRVNPTLKKNTDFDIGIYMYRSLSWREFANWKIQCEDIAWPYKIDLVDLSRAPKVFIETIKQQMIVLHGKLYLD